MRSSRRSSRLRRRRRQQDARRRDHELNAGAARTFGYSAAEAVGRPSTSSSPARRLEEERGILRLRGGEHINHYETVRRARTDACSTSRSPVAGPDARLGDGASKIARDVTDRKRAELEREESNRRKDEFIAILAHELRNPLAPVRNAARDLEARRPTQPEARRQVDMIERQVAMSRLIDDLLDVSRISRGTLELRRERATCSEIVEAAVDDCRDELVAKGQHLRVTMPPAPVELEADRERLVQVLSNVVGNAVKYTPSGGTIGLAASVASPGTLVISVTDDGIGIPPAKLTEIFDLFAQVDQSLER